MSTLTVRPASSTHGPSGSRPDHREQDVRQKMRPRNGRIVAITAAVIGVGLFSILAPMVWDPTLRLSALDDTSTDVDIAAERPFEMHPTHMGPAITSEMLIFIEQGAMTMPPDEIQVTPEEEEIVTSPQG
jgi:ligand-binding SRPBCC domain-containing protein